jgi:hypothetical protein
LSATALADLLAGLSVHSWSAATNIFDAQIGECVAHGRFAFCETARLPQPALPRS